MLLGLILKKISAMENDSSNLYARIAQMSTGEMAHVARIFQGQERKHAAEVESIKGIEDVNPDGSMDDVYKLIKKMEADDQSWREIKNVKEIIQFALQAEKDSIILYGELAQIFNQGSKPADLFLNLIKEEKKHMFYILNVLHELKG